MADLLPLCCPPLPERNRACNYINEVIAFDGAEEVKEMFLLGDQNRALINLVAELKAENRRLRKRLGKA